MKPYLANNFQITQLFQSFRPNRSGGGNCIYVDICNNEEEYPLAMPVEEKVYANPMPALRDIMKDMHMPVHESKFFVIPVEGQPVGRLCVRSKGGRQEPICYVFLAGIPGVSDHIHA